MFFTIDEPFLINFSFYKFISRSKWTILVPKLSNHTLHFFISHDMIQYQQKQNIYEQLLSIDANVKWQ